MTESNLNKEFDLYNPQAAHAQLREMTKAFAGSKIALQAREYDEAEKFNDNLFRSLGTELGIFGLTVPEEFGGHGLDAVAPVIVMEEFSKHDPGFTLSYLAHEVLFVNNLANSGSAAQKKQYLEKVMSGKWIAGMAMSEPGAGTDVLGMTTQATKKGDHYVLNGTKQWITNASVGDVFLVYAKLDRKDRAISAFLVEKSFPGFSVGKKEEKMGMKASPTCQLIFEDCIVPAQNLIGQENDAMIHMMRNLEIERVTLAAQSLGIAARCLDVMGRYAVEREAFGGNLYRLGQIQRLLADSYAQYQAARTLVYHTALNIHPDKRNSLDAAAAKLAATTMAEFVARNAIQVLGGYGYTREYPVERLLRDAILLSIGGGTNEAMQKNISGDLRLVYSDKSV